MSTEAQCNHVYPCTCGLIRATEDRDAAMSLLKLFIAGHRYEAGCKSNGGLACYNCRTVEWLEAHSVYRHVSPPDDGSVRIELPPPSPETGTAAVPTPECPRHGNVSCVPCFDAAGDAAMAARGPAPEPGKPPERPQRLIPDLMFSEPPREGACLGCSRLWSVDVGQDRFCQGCRSTRNWFLYSKKSPCRACGQVLTPDNFRVADGCPCNSGRGVNHGLVPILTCTCIGCDPEQTGSTRDVRVVACSTPAAGTAPKGEK